MYFLIIFLPFFNFLLLSLFGWLMGRKGFFLITYLNLGILVFLGIYLFYEIIFNNITITLNLFNWITISNIIINFGLEFNSITASMFLIIIIISSIVHVYSMDYMYKDPYLIKFISYLSLFTFFMLILITSNNLLQLFLGWEGVGLCSYLLINFWFTRFQANKASLKALIINKISDCFLLLGIILLSYYFKTLNFNIIFNILPYYINTSLNIFGSIKINLIDLICILFLIGAIGKSAQLILHTWLPDAMEGPTPVSALIHAATMVTAGVFIILKCNIIFYYSSIKIYIVFFGAFTAIVSATIGLFQYDIKKVIAYSTCSQLGYMIFSCGLNQYNLSLFHLINHAFFKALLFLTAGSIIHSLYNIQDIRFMGGLLKKIPLSYLFFFIGSLSLSGFPFLTGYYSKDFIIEINLDYYNLKSILSFSIGYITAWLTIFYSIRLIFYIFFGNETRVLNLKFWKNIFEMSYKTFICLLFLSVLSIFFGFFFRDIFISNNYNFINQDFSINKNYFNDISHEYVNNIIVNLINFLPSIFIFILFMIYYMYMQKNFLITKLIIMNKRIIRFFVYKWFFDNIYNIFLSKIILKNISININKYIDKGFIEAILGPLNIIQLIKNITIYIKIQNNGRIYNYMIFYFNFILISVFFIYLLF